MFSTPKSNTTLLDLFFLTIGIGLFYGLWIGSYALFTPDEGRYSEVAREMLVTGDFITPRLNGVGFLDKPILYYWLQASAIKLFGLNEGALRFWPVALGVLGCLMTYLGGKSLFNRRTGLLAAIILATNPMYYGGSHYANMDLEVAVFISSSLICFLVGCVKENKNYLYFAYFFAALAALTKGLIGVFFPAIIVGMWVLLLNRWRTLKELELFSGILIFILIAAPWYWLVQKANPQFFDFFFVTQQFSRFLTKADFNNKTGFWFYIPLVIAGLVPWSIFLFQSLTLQIKRVFNDRKKYQTELYLLTWVVLIFLFFSIPKSKTIGYILPIFPALALIIGHYLSEAWESRYQKSIKWGVISFIIGCWVVTSSCFAIPQFNLFDLDIRLNPYFYSISVIFLIAGMVTPAMFYLKKSFSHLFICILTPAILFLFVVILSGSVINTKTMKPLAAVIKNQIKPEDEVATYFKYHQDLPIYLERRITIVADWKKDDIVRYDNWQRELWFNMPYQDTSDWLIDEATLWKRWQSDKRIFLIMYESYYREFMKKLNTETKNPVVYELSSHDIGKEDHILLISNKKS